MSRSERRRVEVLLPPDLHNELLELRATLKLPSIGELVRHLINRSLDDLYRKAPAGVLLGPEKRDAFLAAAVRVLFKIEYLYESSLNQRGKDGVAAVCSGRDVADTRMAELLGGRS